MWLASRRVLSLPRISSNAELIFTRCLISTLNAVDYRRYPEKLGAASTIPTLMTAAIELKAYTPSGILKFACQMDYYPYKGKFRLIPVREHQKQ
jgi:hypothetical protein